jgi:hypothetical protein
VQVVTGRQSLPLHRLPILLSANRHFSYNGAMLDISISHSEGEPGEDTSLHTALHTALHYTLHTALHCILHFTLHYTLHW